MSRRRGKGAQFKGHANSSAKITNNNNGGLAIIITDSRALLFSSNLIKHAGPRGWLSAEFDFFHSICGHMCQSPTAGRSPLRPLAQPLSRRPPISGPSSQGPRPSRDSPVHKGGPHDSCVLPQIPAYSQFGVISSHSISSSIPKRPPSPRGLQKNPAWDLDPGRPLGAPRLWRPPCGGTTTSCTTSGPPPT